MDAIKNILTDNLSIWSSSIQSKSSAGRGTNSNRKLYGIKKLRELILDLAVRGLLVPQDPNDEPASVLLKKIATEKERLIKEGKIKKQKAGIKINSIQDPFKIPNNWAWAYLPETCHYQTGKTPPTKNPTYWTDSPDGTPWVSIADMNHYENILKTKKHVSEEAIKAVFKYKPVRAGTILMSFKLTLGKISKLDIDAFHNEAIISINVFDGIMQNFVYRFLPTRALAGNSKAAIKGNTLNSESLASILLPIPPLAEQHRIVVKVDELMALCDSLEQQQEDSIQTHETLVETLLDALTNATDASAFQSAWQCVSENFDTLFITEHSIDKLKETILQLAVMGKLVPQDPNDEPASVLLEKIATERQDVTKKLKNNNSIYSASTKSSETKYRIPDQWGWTCLGVIVEILDSSRKPISKRDRTKGAYPYYGASGIVDFIDSYIFDEPLVLIGEDGAKWGKGEHTAFGIQGKTWVNNHAHVVRPNRLVILDKFLVSALAQQDLQRYITGITVPKLNQAKLKSILLPLPPLPEQHRIVAKIDELMALCDDLKQSLREAQTTQIHLTDAVVENAIKRNQTNGI